MNKTAAQIEALLFVAHDAMTLKQLIAALDSDEATISTALKELERTLATTGLRLSDHNDGFRLVTAPEHSESITKMLTLDGRAELTKPALETLSIIAYRGPISRAGIETIRGVNSEATLRNLLGRDLIKRSTKTSADNLPAYIVSTEFLDHYGIASTAELPPLEATNNSSLKDNAA